MSESFFPGDLALGSLESDTKAELFALFPDLKNDDWKLFGSAVACSLRGYEAQVYLNMANAA